MVDQPNNGISKRDFLQSIGMIGGSAAVYTALQGFDLAHASQRTEPPVLENSGKGKKIIVLGAGLAGMVTALELTKKGYDVDILEARDHSGGRAQSAKRGTVLEESGGERQVCNFSEGHYLNYGPWRIPAEHKATLHYCRTLGVQLEPMINKAVHSLYYSENTDGPLKGVPVRQIELDVDRAGNVQELMAKAADDGYLDEMLSADDKEMLLDYCRSTGLLDRKELKYIPNKARGYDEYPGIGDDPGKFSTPQSLTNMLQYKVGSLFEMADHPAVMFQPVGGMVQIPMALERALPKRMIRFNSEITNIAQTEDGVEITYKDTKNGRERTAKADYCISTIPFTVLPQIPNDFEEETMDALKSARSAPAFKLGLEMSRRFWEQDEMIYGGVTRTDIEGFREISYPSSDLHSDGPGVILGAYCWGREAVKLSNMTPAERVEAALEVGEKLHPGKYRKYFTGNAISIGWHKDKYMLAGTVGWSRRNRTNKLPKLMKGEKRVLFGGNGIAPYNAGWMTGAIESAWHVVEQLDQRLSKA
ncbi:flavin monoamine oxidase family protein [Pseudemcibacter aquimaris]|uniref:flavin monoamine oxidase family protein n=1 Tax=Pseudemcibacter aquimaris TaxID=2857064 RepID=UPI002012B97B|nr:flavin monoamine oxidase family protein [Pseudemcibacter aquimaris]MCC3860022.1 flavin monoamine oxidase family protein [Pseudemcibacter aquimaris]WDU57352.1 flavin monoamine oxidase family protein [Pseudemcibacter aquimaris]